jgi:hypothetical protein
MGAYAELEDRVNKLEILLLGEVIERVFVSDSDHSLIFRLAGGTEILCSAIGDCCSESWFAEIVGFSALLHHGGVLSVSEAELPFPRMHGDADDDHGRQDHDQIYGLEIRTGGGVALVVFRNSSNGYYGGWINASQVHATPNGTFREITEESLVDGDWTAWARGAQPPEKEVVDGQR